MKKSLKISVVVIIILSALVALQACNIPDDEVQTELKNAIDKTIENGFDIDFEYSHEVLELYSEKQYQKYLNEDDGEATRTNWNDEESTEWLNTEYAFSLHTTDGVIGGTFTKTTPAARDEMGKKVGQDTITTGNYADDGFGGFLDYWFSRSLGSEAAHKVTYQGIVRLGMDIIRVNIESVLMKSGEWATFAEDGSARLADGTVVKEAGAEDYNWTAGGGIEKVEMDRIDYTITDGAVSEIELYNEHIYYLPADQRNYLEGGRIYTVDKAIIKEKESTTITF